MSWKYLLTEQEAKNYEGAIPVTISTPTANATVYLPPWDTAQFAPDEVIQEIVKYQKSLFPEMKIDKEGVFYEFTPSGATGAARKRPNSSIQPITKLLKQIIDEGYEIEESYWNHNWKTLRDL